MEPTGIEWETGVAGYPIKLPQFLTEDGMKIYFFDVRRYPDLVPIAAEALCRQIREQGLEPDFLVTIDTKGPAIARPVAERLGLPLFIIRKHVREDFVGRPITAVAQPITACEPITFFLDFKDALAMTGGTGMLVDDVVSKGASWEAFQKIAKKSGFAYIDKPAAIFREGRDPRCWYFGTITLGWLPVT